HAAHPQEDQPYMTLWNYSYDPVILGINKDVFDSLSDEGQEFVTRLAGETNEFQIEKNRDREAELIGELKDSGMEVNELSDEGKDAFRAKLSPLYDEYRKVWGPDMAQAFIPKGL